MLNTDYRVYNFGNQRIFAVPANSRSARLAGIAQYRPISRKRSWYRSVMRLFIAAGLDHFVSKTVDNPTEAYGFDFSGWLNNVRKVFTAEVASSVIFWPPQADRGRVYVHLLDTRGQLLGFAKISFDEANDRRLENEKRMIEDLLAEEQSEFCIPRVLDFRPADLGSHAVLVIEPIPDGSKTPRESEILYTRCTEIIAGTPYLMGSKTADQLSWWAAWEKIRQSYNLAFLDELSSALSANIASEVRLCRSHGDYKLVNMMEDPVNKLWIFDWEESCMDGPMLADPVSFYLAAHRPKSQLEHGTLLIDFKERFLPVDDATARAEVMLALAFRATTHSIDADLIISRWEQL